MLCSHALSVVEQEDLGCPWICGTGLKLCAKLNQRLLKAQLCAVVQPKQGQAGPTCGSGAQIPSQCSGNGAGAVPCRFGVQAGAPVSPGWAGPAAPGAALEPPETLRRVCPSCDVRFLLLYRSSGKEPFCGTGDREELPGAEAVK